MSENNESSIFFLFFILEEKIKMKSLSEEDLSEKGDIKF